MNKCQGCGIPLQIENEAEIGYALNLEAQLCQRCFRIKHYNDYKTVTKDNKVFNNILKEINKTNDLVVLVIDCFSPGDLEYFDKYLKKKAILVLTKRDLLPKSVGDEKILEYFSKNYLAKILISSHKNYQLDDLLKIINEHRQTDKVYLIGYTNSGKSTLINKLIYNYSPNESHITTSLLPATTLNNIEVKLNDFTIIDTPGLISEGHIVNYLEPNQIKKITPKQEIKPRTYQVKSLQTIIVDEFIQIQLEKGNLTFFMANQLPITRYYKKIDIINKKEYNFKINSAVDIVIEGLGFIKVTSTCEINIISSTDVNIYLRSTLI